MNDSLGVHCLQGACDLKSNFRNRLSRHRPIEQALFQRLAVEKLHDDEMLALILIDVVNRANVWMIQCRCGGSLAPKTLQSQGIPGHFRRQKFQSHEPPKLRVFSLVDDPKTALPNDLQDTVMGNGLADYQCCVVPQLWVSWGSEDPKVVVPLRRV